jgi:spore coat protein JB
MYKTDQGKLLKFIYEVSFALDDCVLYLDTHPYDQAALDYYEKYKKLRKQAVKEYTQCYGPLTNEDVTVENYWTWIKGPWPWEGVY